jgi:hypothetical protein
MPTAQELMEYRDQESLPMMEAKRRLLDEEAPVLQQWWESEDPHCGEWQDVPTEYGYKET